MPELFPDSTPVLLSDKWVLASAIQKLIRRGEGRRAIELGHRLESLNPGYLRRRLPVIACEDIGSANPIACAWVLERCSHAVWHEPTTMMEIIQKLAQSPKSRTACDLACLHAMVPENSSEIVGMPPFKLVDVALSSGETLLTRAAALSVLARRRETRRLLALHPKTPPRVADVLMRSSASSASLAAMMVLADEVLEGATVSLPQHGLDGSRDVGQSPPLFALDKFTRAGRLAIRMFCSQSRRIQDFRREFGYRADLAAAVQMAIFHLDGCALDKPLETTQSKDIRSQCEEAELRQLGVRIEHHAQLYQAIVADAAVLHEARCKVAAVGL